MFEPHVMQGLVEMQIGDFLKPVDAEITIDNTPDSKNQRKRGEVVIRIKEHSWLANDLGRLIMERRLKSLDLNWTFTQSSKDESEQPKPKQDG